MKQNNPKIKIIGQIQTDPKRAGDFELLYQKVLNDIQQNEADYNISPQIVNDQINYQFWEFEFCGKENFKGKMIKGTLKFSPNHPEQAPKFYFDPVQTDQGFDVLQHMNIYGDHSLCIPLFTHWRSTTSEYEILQAIEHIFHNPNWGQGDAPANPTFSALEPEQQNQIQIRQAKYLKEFEKQ